MLTLVKPKKTCLLSLEFFVIINIFLLERWRFTLFICRKNGISVPMVDGVKRTDLLFPEIAFNHLNIIPAVVFLLGLTAATFVQRILL